MKNSNINRRNFLKIAGFSSLFGLGAISSLQLLKPGDIEAATAHKSAKDGTRWGMAIDTNKFNKPEDFERVIKACHDKHNIPTKITNIKHEIKWIFKDTGEHTFPSTFNSHIHEYVTEKVKDKDYVMLCNHCASPPCVRVCPTKATYKRESDGIVAMDHHRCIGCRFCMAGCPYGSRSFNFIDPQPLIEKYNTDFPARTIGVVEKCTFCVELVSDEVKKDSHGNYVPVTTEDGKPKKMPYCVKACEDVKGMIFGDLHNEKSELRAVLKERTAIVRKAELGTLPSVFYLI